MKYLAIDLETTGLNPEIHQILEVAMIYDNLKDQRPIDDLPNMNFYVKHDEYHGQPYALWMNQQIFKDIADQVGQILSTTEAIHSIENFLGGIGQTHVTPAGKNVNFDLGFLRHLNMGKANFGGVKFRHRVLDIGNLFWRPKTDDFLPDSKMVFERAGIKHEPAHTALGDCRDVVQCVRNYYNKQGE